MIAQVPTGRLAVDGKALMSLGSEAWKSRRRTSFNGAALATIVLDEAGEMLAAPPQSRCRVLGDPDAAMLGSSAPRSASAVAALKSRERRDDVAVTEAARLAVRRSLKATTASGRSPRCMWCGCEER